MESEREIRALMALYDAALAWHISGMCQSGDYAPARTELELALLHTTAVLNDRNLGADILDKEDGGK